MQIVIVKCEQMYTVMAASCCFSFRHALSPIFVACGVADLTSVKIM